MEILTGHSQDRAIELQLDQVLGEGQRHAGENQTEDRAGMTTGDRNQHCVLRCSDRTEKSQNGSEARQRTNLGRQNQEQNRAAIKRCEHIKISDLGEQRTIQNKDVNQIFLLKSE
jgi:hypothetical protein